MAEEAATLTAEGVIEAFKSRLLMKLLFDRYEFADEDQLKILVELHNSGQIDLLSLIGSSEFQEIKPSVFFTGQHFYCEAIPRLVAGTAEMMRCVDALVDKAGLDLACPIRESAVFWSD